MNRNLEVEREKAVIVYGVLKKDKSNVREFVYELKSLSETAGARVLEVFVQRVERFNPSLLVGKGKLNEVKEFVHKNGIDVVIFGNDLTPLQHENLEDFLKTKVVDRTELILDIFAQHARSKEGKIQVELAQLRYRLNQLVGRGKELSRLGGGIGTRGPGETKLEVDRRRIKNRISKLQRELEKVRKSRAEQRKGRKRSGIPHFALVGYTNVGKSSLLNLLAKSNVLVEDKLFATLDPTTRRVYIGDGMVVLVSDTVGFIENLPSDLFEAFKATLEEIEEADYVIHVIDASNFDIGRELESVNRILNLLDVTDKPVIHLFNKIDLVDEELLRKKFEKRLENSVFVSVKEKRGIEELKEMMRKMVERKIDEIKVG